MPYYDRATGGYRVGKPPGDKPKRKPRIISDERDQAAIRKQIANSESEADFDARVVELATLTGWRTYHTHDSRRSESGWPDRAFVRRPDSFLAELKREGGKVSSEQQWWIDNLRACGWDVRVWYPHDWSEIVERLTRDRLVVDNLNPHDQ